jgi:hypothetical protein
VILIFEAFSKKKKGSDVAQNQHTDTDNLLVGANKMFDAIYPIQIWIRFGCGLFERVDRLIKTNEVIQHFTTSHSS